MRNLSGINKQKFPNPKGGKEIAWNGKQFVGSSCGKSVLVYPMPSPTAGWDDDLTDFHEEVSNGFHPIDKASFDIGVESLKKYCPILSDRGGGGNYRNRLLKRHFAETFTPILSLRANCRIRYYSKNIAQNIDTISQK